MVPSRARELLIKATEADSNAAVKKFEKFLHLLPLVPKTVDDVLSRDAKEAHSKAFKREIQNIVSEIPKYMAAANGVDAKFDLVSFWNAHSADLPHLFALFVVIGTLQASSAAAERVFSIWQASFGDKNIEDA